MALCSLCFLLFNPIPVFRLKQRGRGGGGTDRIGGEGAEQPAEKFQRHAERLGGQGAGRGHAESADEQKGQREVPEA
jgi:hypothetical protein